jgi:hypothetical protein
MFGGHITLNGNLNQTINKSTFLLYKKIGEQYYDFQILEKIKSLIPEHIARLNEKQESRLQPKLSIIFKQQVNRIPQTFGALYDGEGKYCALAAVSKCFGYDVEAHKMINDAIVSSADLIPPTVIERIEGCLPDQMC